MIGLIKAATVKFGLPFMVKMYFVPYWINVMWLDLVTYLHHTDKTVSVSYYIVYNTMGDYQ